jgi:hypothetical protein
MLNRFRDPLPEMQMADFGENFAEPIQRQRVQNALLEMMGAPINVPSNAPTARPGAGYGVQPTNGLVSQVAPSAGPYALDGPSDGLASAYEANYGPRRPNPAGSEVTNAVTRSAVNTFGPGTTVVGVSGTGEHGSPRHRARGEGQPGHALDYRVRLPDGSYLSPDHPQFRDFLTATAQSGVSGFGAGPEYMGASTFHMDTYPVDQYSGNMGRAWGSVGDQWEEEFVASYRPIE